MAGTKTSPTQKVIARSCFILGSFSLLFGLFVHLATFIINVPFSWVVVPILLMLAARMLERLRKSVRVFEVAFARSGFVTVALLAYAIGILICAYFYTDGASGVAVEGDNKLQPGKAALRSQSLSDDTSLFKIFGRVGLALVSLCLAGIAGQIKERFIWLKDVVEVRVLANPAR